MGGGGGGVLLTLLDTRLKFSSATIEGVYKKTRCTANARHFVARNKAEDNAMKQ